MSMMQLRTRSLTVGLAASLALASRVASGETLSPYSDFQAMSLSELATLQVKLTYMGEQTAVLGTLLLSATGSTPDPALFTPFRRAGHTYVNDDFGQQRVAASVQELKALIDEVGTLPGVTDGDVDAGGYLSFSLLNTVGGTTKAFEAIVDSTNGPALFGELLEALRTNAQVTRALRDFGCAAGSLPAASPSDVQSLVQVRASGLRADRSTPTEYRGRVRVANTSGATIAAPLFLIVVVRADANLFDADGRTCNIEPSGHPFMILRSSGGLAPGAFIERSLRFTNPSKSKLNVEFKVFAGPGTP